MEFGRPRATVLPAAADAAGPPTSPPMAPTSAGRMDVKLPEPLPCASPQQLPQTEPQLPPPHVGTTSRHVAHGPCGIYPATTPFAPQQWRPMTAHPVLCTAKSVVPVVAGHPGVRMLPASLRAAGRTSYAGAAPAAVPQGAHVMAAPGGSLFHVGHATGEHGQVQRTRLPRKRSRVGVLSHSPPRYSPSPRGDAPQAPFTTSVASPVPSPATNTGTDPLDTFLEAHAFSALHLLHLAAQALGHTDGDSPVTPTTLHDEFDDMNDDADENTHGGDSAPSKGKGKDKSKSRGVWDTESGAKPAASRPATSRRRTAVSRRRKRARPAPQPSDTAAPTSSGRRRRQTSGGRRGVTKRRRRANSNSSVCRDYVIGGPDNPRHYFLQVNQTKLTPEQFAKLQARVQQQAHSGKKGRYYCADHHVCTGCKEVFKGGAPLFRRNELVQDNLYRALRLQACLDVGMKPLSVGAGAGNHHNHNRDGRKGPCSVAARMKRLVTILESRVTEEGTA